MINTVADSQIQSAGQSVALLRELVNIDTTSCNSNLGLIELVRDKIAKLGVFSRLIYDAAGVKANLFATVGEGALPGLLLSGHADTGRVDVPTMPAGCKDSGIRIEFQFSIPGFGVPADDPLVRYVAQHTKAIGHTKVSFGTEAGIFTQHGMPTVVIGPGNIEQAHQPDEFVEVSQLAACDAFFGPCAY